MDTWDAEREIKKKLPTASSDEIQRAIESEADSVIVFNKKLDGRRIKYGDAVQQACENIIKWIDRYAEHNFTGTLEAALHLFTTHRYACAWAVLAAYLHNHKEAA